MVHSPASGPSTETFILTVLHQKSTFSLSIPLNITLQQLCHDHLSTLATLTSTPDQTLYKLILKKPPVTLLSPGPSDSRYLHQLGFELQSGPQRVLLLTTELSEVQKTEQAAQLERRREAARQEALKRPVKVRDTSNRQAQTPYRFHEISLLPQLPFESRRRALLEELANHGSVRAQMLKYEFSVGTLGELHPWSDPGILGVNENAGARIRLRLLTDDLKSVRPFSMVRRVLCHELAHNRFGPHDNDFKQLDSDINKGMLAHDLSSRVSAHRLGGELGDHYEPPSTAIDFQCATSAHPPMPSAQMVGSADVQQQPTRDPRRAAAEAAMKRETEKK